MHDIMKDRTPVPAPRETEDGFIRRFLASKAMTEQYPSEAEREGAAREKYRKERRSDGPQGRT